MTDTHQASNYTAPKHLVLAFDIERSGGRRCDHIIGIGASVVDENGEELDSFCARGPFPQHNTFEPRCWDEFWSKEEEKLTELKTASAYEFMVSTVRSWGKFAVGRFQTFRATWEKKARSNGWKLELVSDNNVYDGGFVNMAIESDILGIPYTASEIDGSQQYASFWETHSEQRGLLMAIDPEFKENSSGHSQRIEELFDCSSLPEKYDHDDNPAHNAYSIAREQQILLGIRDGRIRRKAAAAVAVGEDEEIQTPVAQKHKIGRTAAAE